ncbi:MAG: hypothetical protein WCD44_02130 [Candidatus Babeliales bacterium]
MKGKNAFYLFFNTAIFSAAELEETNWDRSIWLSTWSKRDAKQTNPLKN